MFTVHYKSSRLRGRTVVHKLQPMSHIRPTTSRTFSLSSHSYKRIRTLTQRFMLES